MSENRKIIPALYQRAKIRQISAARDIIIFLYSYISFNESAWRPDLNIAYNPSEPLRITAARDPENDGYEIYAINFKTISYIDLFGINIWDDYDVPDLQVNLGLNRKIFTHAKMLVTKHLHVTNMTK